MSKTLAESHGEELDARAFELNLGKRRAGEPDRDYRDRLGDECARRSGFGRPVDMTPRLAQWMGSLDGDLRDCARYQHMSRKPLLYVSGGSWIVRVVGLHHDGANVVAAARFVNRRNRKEHRAPDYVSELHGT